MTGALVEAQANRPGLDFGAFDGYQNAAASLQTFNNDGLTGPQVDALAAPYNNCVFPGEINGSDLCAATNGLNREQFDQDGTQFSFAWNLTEDVELRYLFGYNELTYQRTTDDDNTASRVHDRQFYVNHEAQYSSHEVQAFVDVNDEISFTSGIFFYDATIDQRGDFYSSVDEARMRDAYVDNTSLSPGAADIAAGVDPNFDPGTATPEEIAAQAVAVGTAAAITGLNAQTLAFGAAGVVPSLMVNLYSAKNSCMGPNPSPTCARNYSVGHSTTEDERNAALNLQTSGWFGDDGSNSELDAAHGPSTSATDLLYATQTKRDAFAVYTQGVWEFAESFSVTAGVRYARDEVTAEENLFRYSETGARPGFVDLAGDGDQGFLALYGGLSGVNAVNGGFEIDPGTGLPLYDQPTQKATNGGIPFALSVYRP
ncbi:MAG TPA: hypothetical protein EYQ54_19995, partial [Myxococcales bacterium]|nr:hypothetical protein [Myxococcales bacterium]